MWWVLHFIQVPASELASAQGRECESWVLVSFGCSQTTAAWGGEAQQQSCVLSCYQESIPWGRASQGWVLPLHGSSAVPWCGCQRCTSCALPCCVLQVESVA